MSGTSRSTPRHQRSPGVLERTLLDGVLVLAPDHPPALALLGTGLAIWRALDEPTDEASLVRTLRVQFDDPGGSLADDVHRTLHHLVERGLVTQHP